MLSFLCLVILFVAGDFVTGEAHSLLITGKKEQIHLRIAELKFYGDLNRKINQELFSRVRDHGNYDSDSFLGYDKLFDGKLEGNCSSNTILCLENKNPDFPPWFKLEFESTVSIKSFEIFPPQGSTKNEKEFVLERDFNGAEIYWDNVFVGLLNCTNTTTSFRVTVSPRKKPVLTTGIIVGIVLVTVSIILALFLIGLCACKKLEFNAKRTLAVLRNNSIEQVSEHGASSMGLYGIGEQPELYNSSEVCFNPTSTSHEIKKTDFSLKKQIKSKKGKFISVAEYYNIQEDGNDDNDDNDDSAIEATAHVHFSNKNKKNVTNDDDDIDVVKKSSSEEFDSATEYVFESLNTIPNSQLKEPETLETLETDNEFDSSSDTSASI